MCALELPNSTGIGFFVLVGRPASLTWHRNLSNLYCWDKMENLRRAAQKGKLELFGNALFSWRFEVSDFTLLRNGQ